VPIIQDDCADCVCISKTIVPNIQDHCADCELPRPTGGARLTTCPPDWRKGGGREFFIDNLLVRINFIIVVIRCTGLAPRKFEFPFPGSLTSTSLEVGRLSWTVSLAGRDFWRCFSKHEHPQKWTLVPGSFRPKAFPTLWREAPCGSQLVRYPCRALSQGGAPDGSDIVHVGLRCTSHALLWGLRFGVSGFSFEVGRLRFGASWPGVIIDSV